jgi:RNA polymerase primary sigma factor
MKTSSFCVHQQYQSQTELLGLSAFQTPSKKMSAGTPQGTGRRGKCSKKQTSNFTGLDDAPEPVTYEQVDLFQGYLNQIGASPLLAKEQEQILGERIRIGLNSLLEHLLASGCVADILLNHARTEMRRKDCAPARRATLDAMVLQAECILSGARERFASAREGCITMPPEVKAIFRELVAVLQLWPGESLKLLAALQSEFVSLFTGRGAVGDPSMQQQFLHRNLMARDACLSFLAEASRLCGAALAARNELVAANLRLVVSEAKKMKQAFLSLEDLVQEGNVGLVTAAERFDERMGNKFSTFAVRLIRSAMRRENDNLGRIIRLPVHRCDALRKFEEACGRLESQLHRPASVQQLAEDTGFACAEVRELFVLRQGTLSIDQQMGEEGDLTMEAFLPDPGSLSPFYGARDSAGCLDAYATGLPASQREVIAYLYGMWGRPQLSPEETAEALGINRAELRRLHLAALNLLRGALSSEGNYLRHDRAA